MYQVLPFLESYAKTITTVNELLEQLNTIAVPLSIINVFITIFIFTLSCRVAPFALAGFPVALWPDVCATLTDNSGAIL